MYERTAVALNRAITMFGVPGDAQATTDAVRIPAGTVQEVLGAVGFVHGGAYAPFVRALLPHTGGDATLRGDEGMHLARALDDITGRRRTR